MADAARNYNRLADAMKTLDELAMQEKDEIKDLLSSQYRNLRKTLLEIEPEVRGSIRHASEKISEFAHSTREAAAKTVKQIGHDVDEKAHEMPWVFMGISALVAAVGGFALGQRYPRKIERNE